MQTTERGTDPSQDREEQGTIPPAPEPDSPFSDLRDERPAVAERATAAAARSAERERLSSLHNALIGGRWGLFVAALTVGVLRFERIQESPAAEVVFGILLAYNIAVLWALSRSPSEEIPMIGLLVADTVTVGAIVALTRGISSPFAGLFYLVTLMAAVCYNLAGGLAVAAAAGATILATNTLITPGFWDDVLQGNVGIQMIPNLMLTGGFAGYLISQLKRLHERRIELEERLRRAWYEERVRRREAELEEQARLREGRVARDMQRAVLAMPPSHPDYEIAVRYEPAGEVGGDFYSFFDNGRQLGVLVGDVSGKGIPAALVATSLSHLSYWLRPLELPRRFLSSLNNDLLERVPEETFATMVFVVLDARKDRLMLYNAGHPPPLYLRAETPRPVRQAGLPLGLMPDAQFAPAISPFAPGDTLVLYSDGFIEARNSAGEELMVEGLEALVRRHAAVPVEELASRLVEETRAFGAVKDDLTLVVVRRRL